MADLIAVAQTDSTNDGSGAATIVEPGFVENAVDDLIIIKVAQSLNSSGSVNNIVFTAPAGYTELTTLRDVEIKSSIFYKRSTGNEQIPNVVSNTTARWTCSTVVVKDVDWDNGGLVQYVQNTGGGDQNSPSLRTQRVGTASTIVCLYSCERRRATGFRYPQTDPTTVYLGRVSTGNSEGVDNCSAVGFDYVAQRYTLFNGPFWEADGGGDSVAFNLEVLTKGNTVPLQSATYVQQAAPSNSLQTNMDWVRLFIGKGKSLHGETLQTWTFDASNIINGDTITVPGHGIDESVVLNFRGDGGTLPGGIPEDSFFYAFPQDANTIKLCTVNEDTDSAADYYYDSATQRPIQALTAGSGTCLITETRIINAGTNVLDILRPNAGSAGNIGPAPGSYVGDAGYNQNWVATAQGFAEELDTTGEVITFQLQVNSSNRLARVVFTLIDADGGWMNWTIYNPPGSPASTGQQIYQIEAASPVVQALSYQSSGDFDDTRVKYLVIAGIGNNSSPNRFSAINSLQGAINLGGTFTIINGNDTSFAELVDLARTYTDAISQPSDLQILSTINISFGDGVSEVSFKDSEKSLAFPPLANGVDKFQNYLSAVGVQINAIDSSKVHIVNSQIGASLPFTMEVNADAAASVDLTGTSYVQGTVTLSPNASYNRQVFVGGLGVTHNNAEVRNSTFIVTDDDKGSQVQFGIGIDVGMVKWDVNADIKNSTFELKEGTQVGHAIEFETPGSYVFDGLTFNNFGPDESDTAAILNSSGGAVSVSVLNGEVPTIRNKNGGTTDATRQTTLTLTGLQPNTEVRVLLAGTTTELAGVENSSTTFTAGIDADSVDIVIHNLGYEYIRIEGADTTGNLTLPIQQRVDRNYANP